MDVKQLRMMVGEARYVWVRILNGQPVEVGNSPGPTGPMVDGSVWWRFALAEDVRKAINEWATSQSMEGTS
jgi:hypothetical protein